MSIEPPECRGACGKHNIHRVCTFATLGVPNQIICLECTLLSIKAGEGNEDHEGNEAEMKGVLPQDDACVAKTSVIDLASLSWAVRSRGDVAKGDKCGEVTEKDMPALSHLWDAIQSNSGTFIPTRALIYIGMLVMNFAELYTTTLEEGKHSGMKILDMVYYSA